MLTGPKVKLSGTCGNGILRHGILRQQPTPCQQCPHLLGRRGPSDVIPLHFVAGQRLQDAQTLRGFRAYEPQQTGRAGTGAITERGQIIGFDRDQYDAVECTVRQFQPASVLAAPDLGHARMAPATAAVEVIAQRVLLVLILVVFLGGVEARGRHNLSEDLLDLSAFQQRRLAGFGCGALGFVTVKDRAGGLRLGVCAVANQDGGQQQDISQDRFYVLKSGNLVSDGTNCNATPLLQ